MNFTGNSLRRSLIRRALYELRGSDILRDPHPTSARNAVLQAHRMTSILSMVSKKGELYFLTRSGTNRGLFWRQKIVLSDFSYVIEMMREDSSITEEEAVRLCLEGDILIRCDCPAFRYFFSYIAWSLGVWNNKRD